MQATPATWRNCYDLYFNSKCKILWSRLTFTIWNSRHWCPLGIWVTPIASHWDGLTCWVPRWNKLLCQTTFVFKMSWVPINTLQPSSVLEVILDVRVAAANFTKVARIVYQAWLKVFIGWICGDSHVDEWGGICYRKLHFQDKWCVTCTLTDCQCPLKLKKISF